MFFYLTLAFLVWAISSTTIDGYYFSQYTTYQQEFNNLSTELRYLSDVINNVSCASSISIVGLSQSFTEDIKSLRTQIDSLSNILESISIKTHILISNRSQNVWYNNTAVPIGATGFSSLLTIADIKYTDYGEELGIVVNSINGIANNSTHGWIFWLWDNENSRWLLPDYSSSKHILHRQDTVAWVYSTFNPWPPLPPF